MKLRFPMTSTAAVAIAIILASEIAFIARTEPLTGLPIFQPTADEATVVVKRNLLSRSGGQFLLVGDSSCMMDLNPAVFEEQGLGQPVNLGTLASFTMPGFAALAEEAMDVTPPPRAVVLAVLPRSFEMTEAQARQFNLIGRYLTAYGRRTQAYELDAADLWSWFVRKHRYNVFPSEFGGSYAVFSGKIDELNGHYQERGTYTGVKHNEIRDTFRPNNYCQLGFQHLAEVADKKGIPLIVWWSPSPTDAVSTEYLAGASRYVNELAAENLGMKVGRPTAPAWDPTWFGTVTHLTPMGARKNSEELASYLKEQ